MSITPCVSLASWSQANVWSDSLTKIYYQRNMAFALVEGAPIKLALLLAHFEGVFRAMYHQSFAQMAALNLATRWRFVHSSEATHDCEDVQSSRRF